MKNNRINRFKEQPGYGWFIAGLIFVLMQVSSVSASDSAITKLNFSSLSGGQVQIQLGLNGPADVPKVFQTDNPSRLALDFSGVKSDLGQKMFTINQGAVNTVYVVEVAGRTRVIINLSETVPYTTRFEDNNFYVVLKSTGSIASIKASGYEKVVDRKITNLLPKQTIKSIDFRRGAKGEGRLLLELSTKNTVVDVKELGGKVIFNFLNTKIPVGLEKSFDVSDFATPVQKIDAKSRGAGATITVTPSTGNYDYSSYQSDGLFTVDFIPLTTGEKEALLKKKALYSGNKLSLNFQDIEVRSVLQILADFTELNIIAADTVAGNVTLRLNDVPWDQALDLILKSKGLAKRKAGNVILVAPTAEIIKIEEEELAAQKVVEQLEPLITEYIRVNYAKAQDFKTILMPKRNRRSTSGIGGNNTNGSNNNKFRLISPRGTVIVDERTNTLIVKDTAKQLEEIRKLINILDVSVRQVLIESRIVVASTSFALNLGVKFSAAQQNADIGSGKSFTAGASGPGQSASVLTDLADALTATAGGGLGLTLARGADYVLNLEIDAAQTDGSTELLSNPRVMTTNRVQAKIKQGVQIPYQTRSQNGPVTELVDAVLELDVTPHITPSGSIIMELNIKKDAPGTPIATGGELTVPIETREVNTTVQVDDGETVVLGGIYEGTNSETIDTVPWFADLPGIGWMFKQTVTTNTKKELLIFITPKIVKNTLSSR